MRRSKNRAIKLVLIFTLACLYSFVASAHSNAIEDQPQPETDSKPAPHSGGATPSEPPTQATAPCDPAASKTALWGMTASEAKCRSVGCVDCHQGIEDMHNGKVNLGCIDCHCGHPEVRLPAGAQKGSAEYKEAQRKAHIQPRLFDLWKTSANPERSDAQLNKES